MKKRSRPAHKAAKPVSVRSKPIAGPPEPDLGRAEKLVLQMLAIPGGSGHERRVADFIVRQLRRAGVPDRAIQQDDANRRSPYGGEIGNLVCRLPGTQSGPRRLLMAHMDTVPLCVGARPVVRGDFIVPEDKSTALGADDRAGAAAVLVAALEIVRRGLPHPPLTFLWTIQEEVGLYGARNVRLGMLGKPRLAFNFDGSLSDGVTVGATGGYRMVIHIQGIAGHAGVAPEKGASAITIAALAVARLHEQGWLGRVEKDGRLGTSNVGVIRGGEATNVVAPQVDLRAEARSHDPAFRQEIIAAIERAFHEAAQSVRNVDGATGSVRIEGHLDYEAFKLPDDDPSALAAEATIRAIGAEPVRIISNGGLDANWMTAHGIPTVTLGAGMQNVHTTDERLDLNHFRQACRISLRLATGTEKEGERGRQGDKETR